jgi:hypothetical protein
LITPRSFVRRSVKSILKQCVFSDGLILIYDVGVATGCGDSFKASFKAGYQRCPGRSKLGYVDLLCIFLMEPYMALLLRGLP